MKKRIRTILAAGFILLLTAGFSQATSLIITGVIDGPLPGGTPKAVELYVLADINDLSAYGLGFANNGGGSDGVEFTFAAISATAGDFLYVASEVEKFHNFLGFTPDAVTSAANMNGDDAVELYNNAMVIDVFGNIHVDGTGQPWEYLDGWAYRKDGAAPGGIASFALTEWCFSGTNALDGATVNEKATSPFPAGSFSPGPPSQPVPTPEPATLLLFCSGMACLSGRRLKMISAD